MKKDLAKVLSSLRKMGLGSAQRHMDRADMTMRKERWPKCGCCMDDECGADRMRSMAGRQMRDELATRKWLGLRWR